MASANPLHHTRTALPSPWGWASVAADGNNRATMRRAILKYAIGVGLGGMLALGTAFGFGQVRTGTVAAGQVTQFCVPPHEHPDAHRFYCGSEDGWSGPTGAAAFACFMQAIQERALPPAIDSPRPCRIAMAAAERMH